MTRRPSAAESGVALLAVLFALTLLMLLALPFGVSMSAGADAAAREVEAARVAQASASVRDLLLADAALSHPIFDADAEFDSRAEWPDDVALPEAMAELTDEGRVTLGGSVEDLQRYVSLDSVSPLLLANLLGTAVRLAEELPPEASMVVVDSADALPDSGYLWIAHEILRYGSKDGNRLLDVERGLFRELGFELPGDTYAENLLALDYRCVLAAAWPFMGRSDSVSRRVPYAAVTELAEMAAAGLGSFTQAEIDRFTAAISVQGMAQRAATWGRPERVFSGFVPGLTRSLRVKSALHVGSGSTVRLRDLATGAVEYGLVMRSSNERNVRDLLLPSVFRIELLTPVSQQFTAGDTVVEPLVPAPVNINTAPRAVLTALFEHVRREAGVRVHAGDNRQRATPPRGISRSEANELADEIVAGRESRGPFESWRDLVERVVKPRLDAAQNRTVKMRWVYFYRNLRTGRDAVIEMGTAPICFDSGPWVRYRAGASLKRSRVAPGVAARHERTGIAAAVPGYQLDHEWRTQQQFEEAFVLDRRSPFWLTTPINVGTPLTNDLGSDPAGRYFPHLVAHAFPELGFGEARYPSPEDVDAGIRPATATAPHGRWASSIMERQSLSEALSLRGWDLQKDGPYLLVNNGPSDRGSTPQPPSGRHDQLRFPFSGQFGFMAPHAASFWLEPQTLEGVTLFDHGDGDHERNRMALHGKDGNLVLELIDEAGIDPNPSDSPAGVERTALEIAVPLPEIGLPADTPVHVAVSAHSGRPNEVALHVDGMPRGKAKFVTYLTAPIDAFDPTLTPTKNGFSVPPQTGDKRYIDIQVEDTEGFPPVGVLRIGTELFEYTAINGNSFLCQWNDSIGGRGARQVAREHAPAIPVDSEGNPTIDISQLSGVNLDVYPEHPVGAKVELYGYCNLLSPDSPMMVGETRLASAIGGFAVARGIVSNSPRPINLVGQSFSIQLGVGIDENWTGDLDLADPIPTGTDQPPPEAQPAIADAFPTAGGYALLIQILLEFESNVQGQLTVTDRVGGVEVIRFDSRQGSKLRNVQRAQQIPGDDRWISGEEYDGQARKFVTDWRNMPWDPINNASGPIWDDIPRAILWVVPISIPVQSTQTLWDPQTTGLTEWVQLYPDGGDPSDTEWVRYDAILGGQHLARGNRRAWDRTRYILTDATGVTRVRMNNLGSETSPGGAETPPWEAIEATSGHIGYIPQVESDFPQIFFARRELAFRGDQMRDFYRGGANPTSSHAHSNSIVTQCQRLQMRDLGNFSALSGRPGRNDRIALVQGSASSGTNRPTVEWHTVNWVARRFDSDNLSNNATPPELLGPWPFQLIAFTDGVRGQFIGPPSNQQGYQDPRSFDRMVKFPSGELPAAWCENVHVGAGVGNESPVTGFVDEPEVWQHNVPKLLVDEMFTAAANTFRVRVFSTDDPAGMRSFRNAQTADWPKTGGLVQIDGEILAYRDLQDGEFTVAVNGRGMLGTEPRDHDRGARVILLTHRPMAILGGQVSGRDSVLPVQALGALAPRGGTVRLGRELLHYTWVRVQGDSVQLEMPRWYPPGEHGTSSLARGLLRARYGTDASPGSSGEAVISWPFRYWDRHAELSDDPELGYSQLTATSAPAFFRSISWREEVQDSSVDVICRVRTDGRAPWTSDPETTPGFWEFTQAGDAEQPHLLSGQGARLEVRFSTLYKSGALDLETLQAHGWKTAAKVSRVRVEYEGEQRIFDERVTAQ